MSTRTVGLAVGAGALVGLGVIATGGVAQSRPSAAKTPRFVAVCTQRKGGHQSKGDLNVRVGTFCATGQRPLKLALYPVKSAQGAQGPQGPAGPQGPPGPSVAGSPTSDFGAATVFVDRGNGPSRFATFSAALGSPAGTTTGGDFRFSCSAAQAPCKISIGGAVISRQTGQANFYPRLLIHKENGPGAAMTFCEYVDGANNQVGIAQVDRVSDLQSAQTAMRTPVSMGVGGTLDCGSSQSYSPSVEELSVPAASNGKSTAYYDVSATFSF
jgi:hypothetical protein